MKLLNRQIPRLILVLALTFALFSSAVVGPLAQTQSKLPAPTGHVSDLAGAVDDAAKQKLENILANLQQRSGINLTVVALRTTGGRDIFDFSRELSSDWDVGARASRSKSLLLVVSVEEKTFATHFSKPIQADLPEGALADMNEQMREPINSGHVAEGLLTGIQKFVVALARKIGFSTAAMDQPVANPGRACPSAVKLISPSSARVLAACCIPACGSAATTGPNPTLNVDNC